MWTEGKSHGFEGRLKALVRTRKPWESTVLSHGVVHGVVHESRIRSTVAEGREYADLKDVVVTLDQGLTLLRQMWEF